jgi:hypothetical protein
VTIINKKSAVMTPVTEYNIINATLVPGAGPGNPLLSIPADDDGDCRFHNPSIHRLISNPPLLLPTIDRLLPLFCGVASASADKHSAVSIVNDIQART